MADGGLTGLAHTSIIEPASQMASHPSFTNCIDMRRPLRAASSFARRSAADVLCPSATHHIRKSMPRHYTHIRNRRDRCSEWA
jgi:hypothetical protein